MLKKILIIIFSLFLSYLFSSPIVKADNFCYLYLNNEYKARLTIPFYLYEIDTYPTTHTNYEYIDHQEKCLQIDKDILISDNQNIYYDANTTLYTKYDTTKNYVTSIILKTNGHLQGYAYTIDKTPPVFNISTLHYETNISSPITLNNVLNFFTSYDEIDGDLTSKIEVIYNDYSSNIAKIGTYTIILQSKDKQNNTSKAIITIDIKDITPPTITGKSNYLSYTSNPINLTEINNNLIVKDNYDKELESKLYVCVDNYSDNKNKQGEYHIYYCVKDNSDNEAIPYKITIQVKDNVPPSIQGPLSLTSYLSSPLTVKEIVNNYIAFDNTIDVTDNIYIYQDNYSPNKDKKGQYTLYLSCKDNYNNISNPYKITINIIDDVSPIIYGENTFTSYLSSPLTITAIKNKLLALDNIDGNITHSLKIIDDTYSNNINKKGTFHLTFISEDSSNNISEPLKVTINSIDDVEPYIDGINSLKVELTNKTDISMLIKNNYTVIDNIDTNINITVENDTYSSSTKEGDYYVTLSCIDSSFNECPKKTIKIEVKEHIIDLYTQVLYLPINHKKEIDEIITLLDINQNYKIENDSYSSNYNLEGTYSLTIVIEDSSTIELTIITFTDTQNNTNSQKKETFFSKIKDFFKNIINKIKTIFNYYLFSKESKFFSIMLIS